LKPAPVNREKIASLSR